VLRLGCAAVVVVAVGWAAAPLALAHEGNPNFRSQVRSLTPAVDGVGVQVVNYDDSLELQNRSGRTVVVEGYREEPYVRILGDGTVAVNHRSPTFYLNDDRFAEGVTVPKDATPKAIPDWQTVDRTGRYAWHDHRIHWMARTLPPQVKDEGRRTKLFDWKVPIEVGTQRATISGSLTWVGKQGGGFPVAAAISLIAAVLAGLAVVAAVRRHRRSPSAGAAKEAW
jgi:hypothetical protein